METHQRLGLERRYKKKCEKIEAGSFDKLLALDPFEDPDYSDWICDLFVKGKLKSEDFSKVSVYLEAYDKNSREIDDSIYNFESLPELFKAIRTYLPESTRQYKRQHVQNLYESGQIHVVYKSDDVEVLIPTTEEASKYLGRGTQWCTAAEKNNLFDLYNDDGPLIIIRLKDSSPYQVHFASNSCMDETDAPARLSELVQRAPILSKILPWYVEKDHEKYSHILNSAQTRQGYFAEFREIMDETVKVPADIFQMCDMKTWQNVTPDMPLPMQKYALNRILKQNDEEVDDTDLDAISDNDLFEMDESGWEEWQEYSRERVAEEKKEELSPEQEKAKIVYIMHEMRAFCETLGQGLLYEVGNTIEKWAYHQSQVYPDIEPLFPDNYVTEWPDKNGENVRLTWAERMAAQRQDDDQIRADRISQLEEYDLLSWTSISGYPDATPKMQEAARNDADRILGISRQTMPEYIKPTASKMLQAFGRVANRSPETTAWMRALASEHGLPAPAPQVKKRSCLCLHKIAYIMFVCLLQAIKISNHA